MIFSDEPCGKNSKLFISQPASTVDDSFEVIIDSFSNEYTIDSYKEYLAAQAERIGQSIFPGQFINHSEVIEVQGPSPYDSILLPRPKSIYGSNHCWVVLLYYGSKKNPRKLKIEFRFFDKYFKDIDDINRMWIFIKYMTITNENTPCIPETMRHIEKMKMVKEGCWIDSEWLKTHSYWEMELK